jgi:integrase
MATRKKPRVASFGSVKVTERGEYFRIRWRENKKSVERSSTSWDEACALARQIDARLASGGRGSPDGVFGSVADAAIDKDFFPNWSDESFQNLRSILRIHIMPVLKDRKARLVVKEDCQAILNDIYKAGHSKHTVAKAKRVFVLVGKHGIKAGVWNPGNVPTDGLTMPTSRKENMDVQLAPIELTRIPSESQVDELLAAAKERTKFDEGRAWFIVMMAQLCALRWSEIRGLTAGSFDWEDRTVSVFSSVDVRGPKKTKTVSSNRRVVMPAKELKEIRKWVEQQPPGGYLIKTASGRTLTNSNWGQTLKKLRKASGYPDHMGLHSLRHYRGSKWRREGKIPLEDISRMMGHSNPTTTQTLYLHSDPSYIDRVKKVI